MCLPLLPPSLLHANSNPLSRLLWDSLRVDCWKRHGSRSSFPPRGPSPSPSPSPLLIPSKTSFVSFHPWANYNAPLPSLSPSVPKGGHYFELLALHPRRTCTQGFSAHVCVLYIRVVALDSGRAPFLGRRNTPRATETETERRRIGSPRREYPDGRRDKPCRKLEEADKQSQQKWRASLLL